MNANSIYVGDLSPSDTELDLYNVFKTFGRITHIKICKDRNTNVSLGYAYVNFIQPEIVEQAISQFNPQDFKKNWRVSRVLRDPYLRKTGIGNIFVKNLDKEIDFTDVLSEVFAKFGTILSARLARTESGESKGYGFVQYKTKEEADSAIEACSKLVINGRQIQVVPFIPRQQRENKSLESTFTNIFVKNIEEEDKENMSNIFSEFGKITSKLFVFEQKYGANYGFINYSSHQEASNTLDALRNCAYFRTTQSITEDEVRAIISKFGNVKTCKLVQKNGAKTYFGYASFENNEELSSVLRNTSFCAVVKNLGDMNESQFKDLINPLGESSSLFLLENFKLGFVNFTSQGALQNAINALNEKYAISHFVTKEIYAVQHISKEDRKNKIKNSNVYVKEFGNTTEDELRDLFSKYGEIKSLKIMNARNESLGFGFILFADAESAKRAVADSKTPNVNNMYVSIAKSKEERKRELAGRSMHRPPFPFIPNQMGPYPPNMPLPPGYPGMGPYPPSARGDMQRGHPRAPYYNTPSMPPPGAKPNNSNMPPNMPHPGGMPMNYKYPQNMPPPGAYGYPYQNQGFKPKRQPGNAHNEGPKSEDAVRFVDNDKFLSLSNVERESFLKDLYMKEIRSRVPGSPEEFYEAVFQRMSSKCRDINALKYLYEHATFSLSLDEAINFASVPR